MPVYRDDFIFMGLIGTIFVSMMGKVDEVKVFDLELSNGKTADNQFIPYRVELIPPLVIAGDEIPLF
ncbi:hypothetical protein [Chryseobacterium sp. FH1]|uniref:hypothetical protein n=1 Tax=Chryseobacterium sp. FH1 TaxID=1233951 RepID=UPI0004E455A6|nr:hypothetical protein [Chryseobacterium sp. FH1]KFC20429.1 hypothetical protein IO90_14835 [Chryseobacterium sp. FH1]